MNPDKKMKWAVGSKRAGNNKIADYPNVPGHNPIYGGGVGTSGMQDPGGHFIKAAIKKPGQLHRDLGVPQGKKIPAKKLNAAAAGKYGKKTEERAHFAKTLKAMH